ncbi:MULTISPECIES: HNH endonuclease [unclassified Sphingobacterium]|uniref:HNH endonuclease n=1 Tax=unclassified Sphingobacterium TaxID=2609468 RepID=UPI0020C4DA1C|nr:MULTISPECIES: HNH endonuclease [unclassified Sphingobacterium]
MIRDFISDYLSVFEKKDTISCPICNEEFSIENPSNVPQGLTKEHVPPHSLGGQIRCYTCVDCNNRTGSSIDYELYKGIKFNRKTFFQNLNNQKFRVHNGNNEVFQGTATSNKDGTLQLTHSNKNNHKDKLKLFVNNHINPGNLLYLKPIVPKIDIHLFRVGLLKSAYLLLFSKIGYRLLKQNNFNIIRDQIMNPALKLYYDEAYMFDVFNKEQRGIYYCNLEGQTAVIVVMNLFLGKEVFTFGVFFPDPDSNQILLNFISHKIALLNFKLSLEKSAFLNSISIKKLCDRLTLKFTKL